MLPWVNSTDPVWQRQRDQFLEGNNNNETRLPSTGDATLEVGIALELALRNMPFIRRLYVVTHRPQQPPPLLNLPPDLRQKIHVVHHDEFMPAEVLPVFNSSAIELYIHRIPDLSENFILMNDDMYVLQPTEVTDFFNPLPLMRDEAIVTLTLAVVQPTVPLPGAYLKALRHTQRTLFGSKRRRFYVRNHAPCPVTKTLLAEVARLYGDQTPANRFRHASDRLVVTMALNTGLYNGQVVLHHTRGCRCYERPRAIPENTRFMCVNDLDHSNAKHRAWLVRNTIGRM